MCLDKLTYLCYKMQIKNTNMKASCNHIAEFSYIDYILLSFYTKT